MEKDSKSKFREEMKYEGEITIPNQEAIQARYEKAREQIKREMKEKKKARNRKIMYGVLGAIAITITGYKTLNKESQKEEVRYTKKPAVEQELVEQELTAKKMTVEEEKESLKAIFNDIYIEAYKIITNDDNITAQDIEIFLSNESYVYVDQKTGEMITHGEYPNETEERLEQKGVSYQSRADVRVYKVRKKEGEVIDCVTMEDGKVIPVIPGEQYGKDYISILEKIGPVIPYGLEYKNLLGKGIDKNTLQDKREQYREVFVNYEKPTKEIESTEITEHDLEL